MIKLKSAAEIEIMRQAGALLSRVLTELIRRAAPGVSTFELDAIAEKMMRENGAEPLFKGYRSGGDGRPFPSTVCTSIDTEVVHAPADPGRTLREGQLLKLDIGLRYRGLCADMAATVGIGKITTAAAKLSAVTKESLLVGVGKVRPGGWISDIGKAVDKHARRHGYSTVKDLVGHGIGQHLHEEPPVPNFFDATMEPVKMEPGMVICIEPMINAGSDEVGSLDDGWTVATADGQLSAHWEVTVAVTKDGYEILTPIPDIDK
ncbi:type I methionyl aminopeptidase [Candidatus Uhrbacteria bacterium RIFCSPHIGHO2_02_FULL_60_10]|uniref:Methionine aminopeptidase n=1 Tax=Candidatus Uhrbacteria bacterium RIFCSPHIGHO2_02_FULL_60_10 TaxID=1802392 RepID=A0A1F7U592_9BACT|nr:MAG: type I methionyl aminopeptidase [Candidatus Uhrbacteria bacterium RIFCSPHIGHO2_02_FULL_60_10]